MRKTATGWILTVARPVRALALIALAGLPGLAGCLYALTLWPGNRAAQLGVLAYVALLALAFAWHGTLVHAVQLDGAHVHARRLLRPLSLPLTSLVSVVVDDENTLRRSASGEWYQARGTQTLVHLGDGSALVCEEPRIARELARRLLAQRPRLGGRPGDRPPPEPESVRLIDVGPASRVRRWGSGVIGPLATVGVALLLLVCALGALVAFDGRPGEARSAEDGFAQVRQSITLPPDAQPNAAALTGDSPLPGAAAPSGVAGTSELAMRDCAGASGRLWSGDRRNGELAFDAAVHSLTQAQLAGVRQRATALGFHPAEPSASAAYAAGATVLVKEADGVRWATAWRSAAERGGPPSRFDAHVGVWTDCLDSRAVPDDIPEFLHTAAAYLLAGG